MLSLQYHHPTVQIPDYSSSADAAADVYSSCDDDDFRMFEFKVRRCPRARSHDWTHCPYAHPGEKARRRDPRRFHYSATPCPHSSKTASPCPNGDACEFSHGVFECWLHPARYRTQPCKDGHACARLVCFFAHGPDQLRVVTPVSSSPIKAAVSRRADSYDGSKVRTRAAALMSPTSILSLDFSSPPVSPYGLAAAMRELRVCDEEEEEEESYDGLDVGWISELIK